MSYAGLSRDEYVPLLAMVPQVAVEIVSGEKRARARRTLEGAVCGEDTHFIGVQETGSSLSITVHTPTLKQMSGDSFVIGGRAVAWSGAGIRKQDVEPGTAYHIPDGSLAVYCARMPGEPLNQLRSRVNADRIKDWMLAVSRDGSRAISSLAAARS
jgi:hypothetical protein